MKKIISVLLVLGVLGVAGFLFWRAYQGSVAKAEATKRSELLPTLRLMALDSVVFALSKEPRPTAVFYFKWALFSSLTVCILYALSATVSIYSKMDFLHTWVRTHNSYNPKIGTAIIGKNSNSHRCKNIRQNCLLI